jgi:hypothetical protein
LSKLPSLWRSMSVHVVHNAPQELIVLENAIKVVIEWIGRSRAVREFEVG